MILGIVELYCGKSGKKGYYNSQEIGLARAMKKLGYSSVVFYPQTNIMTKRIEIVEPDITIVYVPAKSIGVHAFYDWRVLLEFEISVVQIGSDNQIFASSLIKFCERHTIPIYNYIGTIDSDSKNRLKRFLSGILLNRNIKYLKRHKCFAKTQSVYDRLIASGVNDVSVAPVGLDLSIIPNVYEEKAVLRKQLYLPADKKILLFVGRMDAYKKPIEAINLLKKLSNDYYLILIGSGALDDDIDKQIKENSLCNRIKRVKKLPNREIHQYYKSADYFLNFNEKEIFGMSILEAMYQNCTVIAINAPGPKEIIDGKNGFIVDDIMSMQEIITDNLHVVQNNARSSVEQRFTWEKTAYLFDEWIRKFEINAEQSGL